jgi:hypothetical protein
MNRFSALLIGALVVAVSVTLGAAPSMAKTGPATKSGPVTLVTKHGIYKTVVTCPRWVGPYAGPAPLLAAPNPPATTKDPMPGDTIGQPTYSPLVTCTVTFLKDAPAKLAPRKNCAVHWHGHMFACCTPHRHHRHRMGSCLVLNTGFGGMSWQVSRHVPATQRTSARVR